MTKPEALRLVAMLTAYFRQELSDETAALWANEIQTHTLEDGMEATQLLGSHMRFMPSLMGFVQGIRECYRDRMIAERNALPAPSGSMTFTAFLHHNPEMRERVAALGDKRHDRREGRPVVEDALGFLLEAGL